MPLDPRQQRHLAEIRLAGVRHYDRRYFPALDALAEAGLIVREIEPIPYTDGDVMYVCRLTEETR